ncbi:hypothetical protein EE612_052717, partial [Oryza sativa]
ILCENNTSISGCSGCLHVKSGSQFPVLESNLVHGNEISLSCESEVSKLRYTPMVPQIHHVPAVERKLHSFW